MLGVQTAFVASYEEGILKTTWNGTHTLNEYASFVQALRLDV